MAGERNTHADRLIKRGLVVLRSENSGMNRRAARSYIKSLINSVFLKPKQRTRSVGRPSVSHISPEKVAEVVLLAIAEHKKRREEKNAQGLENYISHLPRDFFKKMAAEYCSDAGLSTALRNLVYKHPDYREFIQMKKPKVG